MRLLFTVIVNATSALGFELNATVKHSDSPSATASVEELVWAGNVTVSPAVSLSIHKNEAVIVMLLK